MIGTTVSTQLRRVLRVLAVAILCWPLAANTATELPDLGNTSATVISASEERQLGQEFMRDARGKLRFVDDPELLVYVNALGHKMVANSDAAARDFQFFLIQDSNLNAFAVPGGFISVYTGLILASATESELAAVVAHEIAHISQNHMARMLERGKQMSLPAAAAMIGAILLGGPRWRRRHCHHQRGAAGESAELQSRI